MGAKGRSSTKSNEMRRHVLVRLSTFFSLYRLSLSFAVHLRRRLVCCHSDANKVSTRSIVWVVVGREREGNRLGKSFYYCSNRLKGGDETRRNERDTHIHIAPTRESGAWVLTGVESIEVKEKTNNAQFLLSRREREEE